VHQESDDAVAQLYGPSILPGSRVGGGFHIFLSQWQNPGVWPYHVMQFKIPMAEPRRLAVSRDAVQDSDAGRPSPSRAASRRAAAQGSAEEGAATQGHTGEEDTCQDSAGAQGVCAHDRHEADAWKGEG
jgi:hypothetical protein